MNYEELWKDLKSKLHDLEITYRKQTANPHDGLFCFGKAEAYQYVQLLMKHLEDGSKG